MKLAGARVIGPKTDRSDDSYALKMNLFIPVTNVGAVRPTIILIEWGIQYYEKPIP